MECQYIWTIKIYSHPPLIAVILDNPAVIGLYQPHRMVEGKRVAVGEPLPSYYPAIVPADDFYAVRKQPEVNRGKGGRTGRVNNLFSHVAKCAYCGGPMTYEDKGAPPRGAKYLRCDHAKRGLKCSGTSIRYEEVETLVLENCRKLDVSELVSGDDNALAHAEQLRRQESSYVARLDELTTQQNILADRIATTADARVGAVLDGKLSAVLNECDKIQVEVCRIRKEVKEAMATAKGLQSWQADLNTLVESGRMEDPEFRLQLRERLRQVVQCVEAFTNGFDVESTGERAESPERGQSRGEIGLLRPLSTTDDYREAMDALFEASRTNAKQADVRAFADFVMRRRMSKQGRFIRVHYVFGAVQDLVPQGSLASGLAIGESGGGTTYAPVEPDLDALWQTFLGQP